MDYEALFDKPEYKDIEKIKTIGQKITLTYYNTLIYVYDTPMCKCV